MFVRQSYIYSTTLMTGTLTAQFISRSKKKQQVKNTSLFQEQYSMYKNLVECMTGRGTGRGERGGREGEKWQQN
jgi:hypothetical protein